MDSDKIVLAHGSGGKLTQQLFRQLFQPYFNSPYLDEAHDGAKLDLNGQKVAFSTDTFVVKPLFFPGGNIGDLAVNGTVNDIAMCGASPLFLSAGFVLEEGFPLEKLQQIVESMSKAAKKAGVQLVTGDTKVVEKGSADGVFINTAGIGLIRPGINISPRNAQIGDVVIINGTIADHGIAILSKREGMSFESDIISDTTALNDLVAAVLNTSPTVHVLRDPTRGGLAAALNEIAESAGVSIELNEEDIPLRDQVKAVASLLGIDPLYVANEGKVLIIAPEKDASAILETMTALPQGKEARVIGRIVAGTGHRVALKTTIGTSRMVDMPLGERLPRIC